MAPEEPDILAKPVPSKVWWRVAVASQRRETRRVVTELLAMRGLMPLLMKARNGGRWTRAEREELVVHMRRLTHLSPYLLMLVLPGSVLMLPAYAWWLDRRRGQKRPDGIAPKAEGLH